MIEMPNPPPPQLYTSTLRHMVADNSGCQSRHSRTSHLTPVAAVSVAAKPSCQHVHRAQVFGGCSKSRGDGGLGVGGFGSAQAEVFGGAPALSVASISKKA